MDILSELFSSSTLVKVMRLFYLNPEAVFEPREISRRVKSPLDSVRRELRLLEKIGFIKEGTKEIDIAVKTNFGKSKRKRARGNRVLRGWIINKSFAFLRPLKNLVLNAVPIPRDEILVRLKKSGRLTLVVLSGVFIDRSSDEEDDNAPKIDILVVGDLLKRSIVDNTMRSIEAQIGKELNYSVLSSKEFLYRLGMYDKFIRDILDFPHDKILNKLDV